MMMISIVWKDVLIHTEIPIESVGVLAVTILLCAAVMFDMLLECALNSQPKSARASWAVSDNLWSPMGIADTISSIAIIADLCSILVSFGHVQETNGSQEFTQCSSASGSNMSTSLFTSESSRFVYGTAVDAGDDSIAAVVVGIFLTMVASMKILKIVAKLRAPMVTTTFPCCCCDATRKCGLSVAPSSAVFPQDQPLTTPAKGQRASPQGLRAPGMEQRLSNKLNQLLVSTTFVSRIGY